jgi:hypothetical protein
MAKQKLVMRFDHHDKTKLINPNLGLKIIYILYIG